MIKNLILALTLLLATNFYAQINFEKGYFIDNNNTRTDCYIKNEDKASNPTSFYYKNSLDAKENVRSIENVKEFAIDNFSKFERHEVQIDMSSTDINNLSKNKNPEWATKKVFLRLIVDGDAKLYRHVDEFDRNYFYSYKNSKVEQLVYKQYHSYSEEGGNVLENILENKYFHQQLWNNVKCTQTTSKRISRLSYKQDDLVAYFEEVNNCDGNKNAKAPETEQEKKQKKGNLAIKLKVGANSSSFSMTDPIHHDKNRDMGSQTTYRIGGEFEYILPYKRNKFSIYFEPTYQSKYDATKTFVNTYSSNISHSYKWQVVYSSLDLTLGGKYKSFLTGSSNLFFNLGLTYNLPTNSSLTINDKKSKIEIVSNYSLTFGLGFEYKKMSLEMRMNNRSVTNESVIVSKYKNVSLVLGYKIFESNKKK